MCRIHPRETGPCRLGNHEGLGVGIELGLNGDFVLVVSFVDGHPAISPPDGGVEETQAWVAKDNAEVGGYHAEGQGGT